MEALERCNERCEITLPGQYVYDCFLIRRSEKSSSPGVLASFIVLVLNEKRKRRRGQRKAEGRRQRNSERKVTARVG
jgi:hypothetical protein